MTQPPQYPGTPEPPEEPAGQNPPPIPPQAPAYGAPQPPPYGAPQQPPAYGAPQPPPYGAQNPYGAPAYPGAPGGPGNEQPSKGMAIAALVLSFLACTVIAGLVSIVLAIIVLVRGKDGRSHGKGLAIAAIVISVLVMIGTAGVVALVVDAAEEQSVGNLKTGECINADDLTDEDSDRIGFIDKVSCSDAHDGEVVGTSELTADQASAYRTQGFDCSTLVDPAMLGSYNVYGLTQDGSPDAGDTVACVAVNLDGSRLTERIG